MDERKRYMQQLQEQLDAWNRAIERTQQLIQEAQSDALKRYEAQLEEMQEARKRVQQQMLAMQEAGERAWLDMLTGSEAAWRAVINGWTQGGDKDDND